MTKSVDHIKEWLIKKAMDVRPRTIEQYKHIANRYIIPVIGDKSCEDLTDLEIYNLIAEIPYTRTRQVVYAVLHMIYPELMVSIRKPRHDAKPAIWWSAEQAAAFLRSTKIDGDPLYICWMLAIYCGLRRGELAGLRWQDIDLKSGIIHVRNQRQYISGKGVVDCLPKSRSSVRDIPIANTPVRDALINHQTIMQATAIIARSAISPYVVCVDNKQVSPSYIDHALKMAIENHDMQRVTCHQLRHTCATICITEGVPLNVVSALLGHGGVAITAAVYAHVQQSAVRDAIAALGNAIFTAEAPDS